jgi:hypothetical protein
MRNRYYYILKTLPLDLSFEELQQVARENNLDAIILFLLYNDRYIMEKRPDIVEVVFNEEIEVEEIEDWL